MRRQNSETLATQLAPPEVGERLCIERDGIHGTGPWAGEVASQIGVGEAAVERSRASAILSTLEVETWRSRASAVSSARRRRSGRRRSG
jgi:hypothetical protein